MTWTRVAVYWTLALVVCAQLAWTAGERGGPQVVEAPRVEPIVTVDAALVDGVRIETSTGVVELGKEAGRWGVIAPAGVPVSSDLVSAFLDALTTIPPIEVLAKEEAHLSAYGLAPAQTTVRLAGDGNALATIELGQRNPTRTAVYAQLVGDDRLYLIGLNAQYYLELIYEQVAASGAGATDEAL